MNPRIILFVFLALLALGPLALPPFYVTPAETTSACMRWWRWAWCC